VQFLHCIKFFQQFLKLLAPIPPLITEHLWLTLYSEDSIHKEQLPEIENVEDMTAMTQPIIEFNSRVWNEKKQNYLSLKDSIKIEIPEKLDQFKKDLIAMHYLETD
jgi:Valyl-tRNA synthetase